MYAVDNEIETVHVYVVREDEAPPRPFVAWPLFGAMLCLLGIVAVTLYSGTHPTSVRQTLRLPAHFFTLTLQTTAPVVPTGVHAYPATFAHGVLTFSNGSVIGQSIPAGFTLDGVATDQAVYVPAGSADGYGYATAAAHALTVGQRGNFPALSINSVIGSSLYVRNLTAFTGGRDAFTVRFITAQDRLRSLHQAQHLLAVMASGLHPPCQESWHSTPTSMTVLWRCSFVRYSVPSYMHVVGVQLHGTALLVSVISTARPAAGHWVK